MSLKFRFKAHDKKKDAAKSPIKYITAQSQDDFNKIKDECQNIDLILSSVIFIDDANDEDDEIMSSINEAWTIDSLKQYACNVDLLGGSYFAYCEVMNSRNPAGFDSPESFNSFADAGNAVAERYFDVPEGGLRYIKATQLAKDIMNGEGPAGLPDNLLIFTGPNGDPVYMIDSSDKQQKQKMSVSLDHSFF